MKKQKNKESSLPSVTRRNLLKTTLAGSLYSAVAGLSLPFSRRSQATTIVKLAPKSERVVWSACSVNCGSRCPLRLHVVDGEITYVETDNVGQDELNYNPQVRACLRGRSMRRKIYHPDRLKYPMKRVGKRGENKFKKISWQEAYDEISAKLKSLIKEHGNESIYINYGTGTLGGTMTRSWPPGNTLIARLMNLCGGYLNHYGDYSTAQIAAGLNYTYGGWATSNSISDIANSQLVVLFGNNPAETRMSGGGITYYLAKALEKSNAKMIMIDPRYNDTAAGREDEWIAIRPGTDAALVAGIAHVLITENLVDKPFLDKYCVGYDETTLPESAPENGHYKAYILGQGADGIAKTPEWAAKITGIPVQRIMQLAREIGAAKPACIIQGWGPQRRANGENICRAISMLPILTGNIGINGGGTGAREQSYSVPYVRMSTYKNPVTTSIPMFMWTDAITRASEMTALTDGIKGADKLNAPIKFIWNYSSNCLVNQHSNINQTHDILQDDKKCEMIVVIDNFMTSSAQYADIILPDCTTSEQMDFYMNGSSDCMGVVIFADKAIEPRFECQTIYSMLTEIARRMGVEKAFTEGRTHEEWLKYLHQQSRQAIPSLPDFEQFKQQGIYREQYSEPYIVAYQKFRQNPEANPLTTPSGKIEIYSQQLADIAKQWQLKPGEVIDPLPVHAPEFAIWTDEEKSKYPLHLIGFHYKARTHSTYGNIDVLKSACRQEVWMNPVDANSRNIKQGDLVSVFNQYGEVRLSVKVTPRIMPGVTGMGQGAWLNANMFGDRIDHGGCINMLTTQKPSPLAKGNPQHSNLVEIRLIKRTEKT